MLTFCHLTFWQSIWHSDIRSDVVSFWHSTILTYLLAFDWTSSDKYSDFLVDFLHPRDLTGLPYGVRLWKDGLVLAAAHEPTDVYLRNIWRSMVPARAIFGSISIALVFT